MKGESKGETTRTGAYEVGSVGLTWWTDRDTCVVRFPTDMDPSKI